ncbi:MAG: glycerate kinase [Candidatus Neomarinimicrobiota bacterium]
MKIVIAPDSFKGSLTAHEATTAMSNGVLSVLSNVKIEEIPLADGGDGTMDSLVFSTGGQIKDVLVLDPLGREIIAQYGILGDRKTAVIELATASGLILLKKNELNPLITTTYGTGQLILQALDDGFRSFIICIGGSATNDCGAGMAQAIGLKFLNTNNVEILGKMCGDLLGNINFIDSSNIHPGLKESRILVACDVNNPLLGQHGCAHIYAPQKGASPKMIEKLESNMKSFIKIAENKYDISVRDVPGAGAAGGLGAGLMLFLKAELKSGIDIVLKACDFQKRIKNADLIITGEGKIDDQTIQGKTISGIVRYAKLQKIPIIAFAGVIENGDNIKNLGISNIFSISSNDLPVEKSIANASTLLQNKVESVIRKYYNKI